MSNIFRGTPSQLNRSALGGRRAWKGVSKGGVDWSIWFDHFWQAKGVASYAASLLDLVGAQALSDVGGGAVPWAAGTGWGFVTGNAQWLDTSLIPDMPGVDWTIMVQYVGVAAGSQTLIGAFDTVAPSGAFLIQTTNVNMGSWHGSTANTITNAPQLASGNYAISGKSPYRDGVVEGSLIPGGVGGAISTSLYIGALNLNGAAVQFQSTAMVAVGIKKGPVLTAPQVLAAATAMALI